MPSGTPLNPYDNVNIADLCTVKFHNLFDRDEQELETLLKACERDGFFYLDLQGSGSGTLWKDLDRVGKITKSWFAQPVEVKLKTPTVSLAHGFVYCLTLLTTHSTNCLAIRFKATGNQSGAVESLKDGFEALKVCINPTDDLVWTISNHSRLGETNCLAAGHFPRLSRTTYLYLTNSTPPATLS